jgi:hypothetical protein
MTAASATSSSRFRSWFRRFGRALVLGTLRVVLVAPRAVAHDDRPLSAHVEAPRTVPHPGHHVDECPACLLLSVHGRPADRPRLDLCEHEQGVAPREAALHGPATGRHPSNSSRAPPSAS